MGAGSSSPRTDEGDEFGKDGVAAEENRRVEMYCFDDQIFPPVPGPKASKGEPEVGQWEKQVTKTVDLERKLRAVAIRLYDYDDEPVHGVPATVLHAGGATTGTADENGILRVDIETPSDRVLVEWVASGHRFRRRLHLDPPDTAAGDALRLRNLGYLHDEMNRCVLDFQADYRLERTGVLADIAARLRALHDRGVTPGGD